MAKPARPHRAARVSVPNQEQAIISAEGRNIVGVLCKLSLTGGSLRLPRLLRSGTLGLMTLETATGRISAAVEFLSTADTARVQAFRFIHLDPDDRRQLDSALQKMLKQGLGEGKGGSLRPLAELAQRALGVARKAMG